jgi:predicted AAA+ superfamily ATPase
MKDFLQVKRFLGQLLPKPPSKRVVLITGARQTGKTSLSKAIYPEMRYINLDAPENREALRGIPTSSWGRDVGNAVIDEAQKEPVVFEKVKFAFDAGKVSFCVLTGSSQILLIEKIRETLAGRISLYEMWPLMAGEIFHGSAAEEMVPPLVDRLFSDDPIDRIFGSEASVLLEDQETRQREAQDYLLQWGGMPALLHLPESERWKWLRDYEYTYLERDLADLARLNDLDPFRKFQKLSALRSGKLLQYSDMARDAGVSADTAKRYLEYLRLSYQAMLLQPYHRNITSAVVKTPKLYWVDLGILRQLCGFKGEPTGEMYETYVVGELVKWMKTVQREAELYFYRTRSGLEIDLVLETQQGIVGMEIKSRATVGSADVRSLREVAAKLGGEWRGGIAIYRGKEIRKIAEPSIWAVPSHRLFIG